MLSGNKVGKIAFSNKPFVYLVEMEIGNGNSYHFHTATDTGDYTYGSSNVFYAKHIAQRICATVGVNGLIRDCAVVRRRGLL